MAVNGTHGFESQKNKHRQNQIKPCGLWWYIEVLRHETIGLCKKLNSTCIIFYLWSTAMSNCPERVHNSRHVTRDSSTSVSCTDRSFRVFRTQCIVTSCRVKFGFVCVCFFLTLKAVGPIDCHYMTDRLQQFELKIFVCVLLKKQIHLHLGCPGGKQINNTFSFLGKLSL